MLPVLQNGAVPPRTRPPPATIAGTTSCCSCCQSGQAYYKQTRRSFKMLATGRDTTKEHHTSCATPHHTTRNNASTSMHGCWPCNCCPLPRTSNTLMSARMCVSVRGTYTHRHRRDGCYKSDTNRSMLLGILFSMPATSCCMNSNVGRARGSALQQAVMSAE